MANQAAGTAVGTLFIVAVEQSFPEPNRLIQDDVAISFLPPSLRFIARLAHFTPARQFLISASERKTPGIWAGIACRKRYIDAKMAEALDAGIEAVVNLGAGFDTRAYRLPIPSAVPVFEVDLPENIEYKRARLQRMYGGVPAHVTLVPIDFDDQDLETVLPAQGYRMEQRTFFIWEGVTQYLTEEGVRKTFGFLARAKPASRLAFSYVRKDFIDGVALYGLEGLYQTMRVKEQVWRFGIAPEEVAGLLDEHSWHELEQVGRQEALAWYVRPSGRALPVAEIERVVYAERT